MFSIISWSLTTATFLRGLYFEVSIKTSPIETLHVEANYPPLELRRNGLGIIFLHKLKSNTAYTESLNTLDDK